MRATRRVTSGRTAEQVATRVEEPKRRAGQPPARLHATSMTSSVGVSMGTDPRAAKYPPNGMHDALAHERLVRKHVAEP